MERIMNEITIQMNRHKQFYFTLLTILCLGCVLITGCEVTTDQDEISNSVASGFELQLEEVLDIMSDEPENAISLCDKIIEEAESVSSTYYVGKAKWYQAYIYDKIVEDVSKAYFGYNDALRDLKQTDDATIIVKVSNNLAILNQYYAQYDVAENIYLETLDYKDEIDGKLLSNIYYNLGRTYQLKGDKESFFKAEEAFTNSLEVARDIDDDDNIASVYNEVGIMYSELGNYDMARIAFKNTIQTYENEDPSSEILDYVGKAYHGIGVTYMEEENYTEAIASFEKALLYEKNSGTMFITKYDLGTVLLDAGQVDKAITTWKDALTEKYNKNERIHVEIYAKLTSALAARNEFEEAVEYAQAYNEQIESILSVGDKYKSENSEVIFADIIREYDEFNRVIPFYEQPWFIVLMVVLVAGGVYAGSTLYYRSRLSHKVSDTMSKLQIEFQNIKLE